LVNIPVVTSQWLADSFKAGQFLPPTEYLLPIFKGLTIGVLGYNNEEISEIKSILEKHGGEIDSSLQSVQEGKGIDLIMVKNSEIRRYESFILAHNKCVVTIEWLKNCLLSKQYLKPKKYSINALKTFDRQSHLQRLNDNLNSFLPFEGHFIKAFNELEVGDDRYEYLEKVVIYFHNIPDKIEKIQKRLVNLGGGIYVKDLVPEVTHIIVDEYTEDEIKTFNKYRKPKIVEIFWLKDCFLYKRLLKEDDYYVQPLPQMIIDQRNKTPPSKSFTDMKPSVSLNRRNTISYPTKLGESSMDAPKLPSRSLSNQTEKRKTMMPKTTLSRNDTIQEEEENETADEKKPKDENEKKESIQTRSYKSGKTSKSKKVTIKTTGFVFKNINIYFDPKFKEAAQYKKLVQENAGNVLDSLNVFEEIFYVLPDSEESLMTLRKNNKRNIKFVSYRWIDYCLKNKMVIRDFKEKKLIYLFPFQHKVPLPDFSGITIYAAGLQPYEKKVLKEMIELMGAKFSYEA